MKKRLKNCVRELQCLKYKKNIFIKRKGGDFSPISQSHIFSNFKLLIYKLQLQGFFFFMWKVYVALHLLEGNKLYKLISPKFVHLIDLIFSHSLFSLCCWYTFQLSLFLFITAGQSVRCTWMCVLPWLSSQQWILSFHFFFVIIIVYCT